MSRVCVFGDSITWGSWDPRRGGWVGRLREAGCLREDLSNPEQGTYTAVYNCGISGDKLSDVLTRFDVEAMARQPAAVVIAIGINDIPHDDHPGTPAEEFRRGYERLVTKARSIASDVVLVTPTNVDETRSEHAYRNADIAVLAEVVRSVAGAQQLPLVDVFGLMTPQDLEPDGLHPGEEGHARLHAALEPSFLGLLYIK